MATDKGNRATDSEIDSGSVEQEESIIQGWCGNCTCVSYYHIGDNNGICMECGCPEFTPDDASELLDRLKGLILKEPEIIEIPVDAEEVFPVEPVSIVLNAEVVFIGKASRECTSCGDIKLYKDFNNSSDPKILCNYCAWELAEISMLSAMNEKQQREIEDMEDQILENEMAYEEALERQEMIDECLRGLDE